MTRQARDKRRSGARMMLTPRDEALLRGLNRFRIARSSDLARVYFDRRHRDVVADRLRKLFDGRFVATHVIDRAAANVYSLAEEGKAWLRAKGEAVRGIPRPPWAHHLAIVGFWSRVAVAARRVQGLSLRRFLPDWEIREQGLVTGLEVVPDALAELSMASSEEPKSIRLVVELDRGTESLETLRRKIRAFARLRFEKGAILNWPTFDLCIVLDTAGVAREPQLRDRLAAEWPARLLVWNEATDLADEFRTLVSWKADPVTDSLHGYGSPGSASAEKSSLPRVTGGGLSDE